MSDSMPMLANTSARAVAEGAAGAALKPQTAGQEDANGFNALFQSYMNTGNAATDADNNLAMLLVEGQGLPVFATSELSEGNSLPHEQPLVQWSALMLWDDNATNGNLPQLTLPENGKLANSALLNYSATQQPNLQPASAAEAEIAAQNLAQSKLSELQLLNNMPAKLTSSTPSAPVEQLVLSNSDTGLAQTNNNAQQSLFTAASLSQLSPQKPKTQMLTINLPPQHPNWGQALGERIQWMVGQNIQQAEVRLDPPELGTIEVRIQVNKDQANVTFMAANAQVRDAVESASARLREMFGEVGLSLGDVNVSQESFAQQQQANERHSHPQTEVATDLFSDEDPQQLEETRAIRNGVGLLDTYA